MLRKLKELDAQAAEGVIEGVTAAALGRPADPWQADTWVEVLRRADAEVAAAGHGGESTAVVLALGEQLAGASVGDSVAWLFEASSAVELTGGQQRRPMIGSGSAAVLPIAHHTGGGTVLLASDNLYLYENLELHVPIAATLDSASNLRAQERMLRLASDRRLIIPGHDPAIFQRFPTPGNGIAKIE